MSANEVISLLDRVLKLPEITNYRSLVMLTDIIH